MHTPLYRKANYLVLSNTGIYTFRWNRRADNKHYQPKLSLKTRNYLEAMRQASVLAIQISSLHNPTIEAVRAICRHLLSLFILHTSLMDLNA